MLTTDQRESRWAQLLVFSLLGLAFWMVLTGADGDLPPTAANGVSLAAVMAALALLVKMLTPLLERFMPREGLGSPDAIRRETEARMIIEGIAEKLDDQTEVLGQILAAVQRKDEK